LLFSLIFDAVDWFAVLGFSPSLIRTRGVVSPHSIKENTFLGSSDLGLWQMNAKHGLTSALNFF